MDWLTEQGIAFPAAANTWTGSGSAGADTGLLVARLGTGEFFLEDVEGGDRLRHIAPASESHPPGVYPVLRQDAAFSLSGDGGADVLAQVCNVNFSALVLDSRPVIMTLMVGVAVLVVPRDLDGQRQYLIWCDPTFGPYLAQTLGNIVIECGGNYKGVPI
jgi:sarcosine oxidase subunit gamma